MRIIRMIFNLNNYLQCLLILITVLGDFLFNKNDSLLVKAIFDNATHSIIGGFCWLIFHINSNRIGLINSKIWLIEILMCCVLSSLIDLDHFIMAKSFRLEDSVTLKSRPFLHCSTIPLILCSFILCISYTFQMPILKEIGLILITAFTSHHIRDATRRGLWFYPFGHTGPIPYWIYVFMICLVPYLILIVNNYVRIESFYYVRSNDNGRLIDV